MTDRHDLWTLLDKLQMDIKAADAKLTSIRSMIAAMNLAPATKTTCPHCGLSLKGPRTLAEHVHQMHDGPMPAHWERVASHARAQTSGEEPEL
jgi:hypothetical protein